MPRSDDDFSREIEAHLQHEADRLIADGVSPEEARRAARRAFGNVARVSERFYESRRVLWLNHLRHDVRCAFRSIARTPIACAVAVASLAAGIAATTATLTVRNAIFYNPPPLYRDPGQLSTVSISRPDRPRDRVSGALFRTWQADAELARQLAAAVPSRPVEIRAGDRTEMVGLRAVTPNLFAVLGVQPALGRSFDSGPAADGPPPVVLSDRIWQTVFGQNAGVLGTIISIDQQPYTVVGVMPRRFWFGRTDAPVWTAARPESLASAPAVDVVVRRPHDVSLSALAERLQRDTRAYLAAQPGEVSDLRVLVAQVGGTGLASQIAVVIPWMLGMAVLLTVLIASANVAILMFARWTSREREMAIRSALGAGRGRAIALLLTESIILALGGGVLGVCATFALRGLLVRNAPGAADVDLSIDTVVLIQSAIVALVAGALAGIAPAIHETRRLHTNPLRGLVTSDRSRQRWRHALVILEISVTVALMVVAGAHVDASRRMLTGDFGFDPAPLLTARVENQAGVDVGEVLDTLRRVPGIVTVAAATAAPMAMAAEPVRVGNAEGTMTANAERALISADYFAALGLPLRTGRTFVDADLSVPSRIAIVDETLMRQLWPGRDGDARRVVLEGTSYEVVGVVGSHAARPLGGLVPRLYLPFRVKEKPPASVQIIARSSADPSLAARGIRHEVRRLGATYAVPFSFAYRAVIEVGAREVMSMTYVMSPLLGIGLFLTATGIFGVLAFTISRRSTELALRVVLGAPRSSIARRVIAHTLALLTIGSAVGAGGTFGLTRLVRAAGGGGTPFDTPGWAAFAIPVLIILSVGIVATWIPTRRALAIDPARLLRAE
jgi:predicted permease